MSLAQLSGTIAFVLAVVVLVQAVIKRAARGHRINLLLFGAGLLLGTLHYVIKRSTIAQTTLSVGSLILLLGLIFRRLRAKPASP